MPRDYAKNSSREPRKSGQLPGWVWMLGGLAVGLFVAFVVYLNDVGQKSGKDNLASVIKETFNDLQENAEQHKQKTTSKQSTKTDSHSEKTQNSRKEKDKPKPSFDFYYILPELEVAVPEQELARKSSAGDTQDESIDYILQAGSFRSPEQADQLKATLALKGITASIQTVSVNSQTWHRVRIGPIRSMNKLTQTRKRLRENGIDAIVVKNRS